MAYMDVQTILSTIGIIALIANAVILLAVFIAIMIFYNFLKKTKQDAEAAVEMGQRIMRSTSRNLSIAAIVGRVVQAIGSKKSSPKSVEDVS